MNSSYFRLVIYAYVYLAITKKIHAIYGVLLRVPGRKNIGTKV